jgi:hypothetical protein
MQRDQCPRRIIRIRHASAQIRPRPSSRRGVRVGMLGTHAADRAATPSIVAAHSREIENPDRVQRIDRQRRHPRRQICIDRPRAILAHRIHQKPRPRVNHRFALLACAARAPGSSSQNSSAASPPDIRPTPAESIPQNPQCLSPRHSPGNSRQRIPSSAAWHAAPAPSQSAPAAHNSPPAAESPPKTDAATAANSKGNCGTIFQSQFHASVAIVRIGTEKVLSFPYRAMIAAAMSPPSCSRALGDPRLGRRHHL